MSGPFRDAALPGTFRLSISFFQSTKRERGCSFPDSCAKQQKIHQCKLCHPNSGSRRLVLDSGICQKVSASRNLPKSTISNGNLMVSVSKFWEQNPFWPLFSDSSFWKGDYSKPKSAAGTKLTRNEHLSFVQSLGICGSAPRFNSSSRAPEKWWLERRFFLLGMVLGKRY